MSVPGVGTNTAMAFIAAIEAPRRFGRTRHIGPPILGYGEALSIGAF